MLSKEVNNKDRVLGIVETEQLRELERRLTELTSVVDEVSSRQDNTIRDEIVPALVNLANNSDFLFSDSEYELHSGYTEPEDVVSLWYTRTQATASSYTENTNATESSESIRSSAHSSGLRTGAKWDTTEGNIKLTGGYRLAHKLALKYANRGNYIAVRMQLKAVTALTIDETIMCKVSIWDNTANEIIKGTKPTLSLAKVGSHTGGTVTREYVLEVQMPDGRRFYSDTGTPASITNTVSPLDVDRNNSVTVDFEEIIGATRYRIFRRATSGADTNWYLVSVITNGSTIFVDYGGTSLGLSEPPSVFDNEQKEYQRAEAFYLNVGELLQDTQTQEITLAIQVPTLLSATTGDQFLQIEFLKSDYTAVTTTEIPSYGISIDKVGFSYTNGRWCPSARDLQVGTPAIDPLPPPTGGGDGTNPPAGDGENNCVDEDTPILIWDDSGNHYYMPAKHIVIGDRLVSWDYKEKRLAPSTVYSIIGGISKCNYIIHVEDKEVSCSFSHKFITSLKDFINGTRVSMNLNTVLVYSSVTIKPVMVEAIEMINDVRRVRSFKLTKNRRNYIANGIFCHNRKDDEGVITV